VAAVSRPQVTDDTEHERVHDRVAAIDAPHKSLAAAPTAAPNWAAVRALGANWR
jgi:hypothetical protein